MYEWTTILFKSVTALYFSLVFNSFVHNFKCIGLWRKLQEKERREKQGFWIAVPLFVLLSHSNILSKACNDMENNRFDVSCEALALFSQREYICCSKTQIWKCSEYLASGLETLGATFTGNLVGTIRVNVVPLSDSAPVTEIRGEIAPKLVPIQVQFGCISFTNE